MSNAGPLTVTAIRPKDDVVARTVGEEMILLDLESGTYFTLNRVGGVIWQSLESGTSVDSLIGRIVADFEVDEATASRDVADFLADMAEQGLLATA